MKDKTKKVLKRIIAGVLCAVSAFTVIMSAIPVAEAKASASVLGTNTALGSPILNADNFSTEDWNPWETICWGVFLSNFCQPLIDTYESAFTEGHGGSNGHGFTALWNGSGNDSANAGIIEALCKYAIDVQKSNIVEQIYVSYSTGDGWFGINKKEPSADNTRVATFRDLWYLMVDDCPWEEACGLSGSANHTHTSCVVSEIKDWYFGLHYDEWVGYDLSTIKTSEGTMETEYTDLLLVDYMALPTFSVERTDESGNTNYLTVLDYTDWWDAQIMSAMGGVVRTDSDTAELFKANMQVFWDNDTPIGFDVFGNIVTNLEGKHYIILPAAANQNITAEKSINVLNSWLMNSYVSTVSNSQMILGLGQKSLGPDSNWIGAGNGSVSGFPAFSEASIGNIGLFYYDTDSIVCQRIVKEKEGILFGDLLNELFSLDINDEKTNSYYPLKFEIAGAPVFTGVIFSPDENTRVSSHEWVLYHSAISSSLIPNLLATKGEDQRAILSKIVRPDGSEMPIFSEQGVAISVKAKTGSASYEPTNEGAVRYYFQYLYNCARGRTTVGGVSAVALQRTLKGMTFEEFVGMSDNDEEDGDTGRDRLFDAFKNYYDEYRNISNRAAAFDRTIDYADNETIQPNVARIVIAYPPSTEMVAVSSVLGIRDGTEFATYCSYIYMTYLDFYGIATNESMANGITNTCKFDSRLFNTDDRKVALIGDIAQVADAYGEDFGHSVDIEEEVAQMSYYMLEPEEGREYRKQLVLNGMTDWMYEQYSKTVFGGSGVYSGSASKAKSGFLSIEPYADNWLTSWFINSYVDIVIWAIMGGLICIIIVGLIKGKKISWYAISSIVLVNVFLLVPASGELVPYVTSSITQKMFSDKMTMWSVSQGVTNNGIEADAIQSKRAFESLSMEQAQAVVSFIKDLSMTQVDSTLSVKQDISQKITQKLSNGVYSDIESYQSARWILPMVMQQFSGEDNSEVYIYKPLTYIWDDLSNMYWYFKPEDAEYINNQKPTATSGQTNVASAKRVEVDGNEVYDIYNRLNDYFLDGYKFESDVLPNLGYTSTIVKVGDKNKVFLKIDDTINYRCYCYNIHPEAGELVHLVNFYLDDTRVPLSRNFYVNRNTYQDADSWQRYIDGVKSYYSWFADVDFNVFETGKFVTGTDEDGNEQVIFKGFEYTADSYLRGDRDTITSDMPYLLATESPIYYFYAVVKDSLPVDSTLSTLIYNLQGEMKEVDGKLVRYNFMYAGRTNPNDIASRGLEPTGYLRDVLDLEAMFTNMIPYMYQMNLITNGFDGESGLLALGDEPLKISDELNYYAGENQSWMYRCNWAIKIMENPNFSEPAEVRDSDGNYYMIKNPLLPEMYPAQRPMVFSEAQMVALGLTEADLNLVELECLDINEKVSKQWTLLLNYAGTAGITKEVLMRQMATDATLIFCQELSTGGIIDTTYQLYPQSLDLRYISFDSIMKMLIMNVSKDTSYIYGDTMINVIQDSDVFTAILLLLAAWLCAFLVPLFRTILMALIFYLGFISIIKGIFQDGRQKANVACGQLISNLLFMGYTIAYFAIFWLMMNLTSADEVLTVRQLEASPGSPAWVLLAIIAASIFYMVIMVKHFKFCISNRADMGFEQYSMIASSIVGSIKDTAGRARDSISSFFSRSESSSSKGTNTSNIKGTGIGSGSKHNTTANNSGYNTSPINGGNAGDGDETTITSTTSNNNVYDASQSNDGSDYTVNYSYVDDEAEIESIDSSDIDAVIDTGSSMEDDS